MSLSISAIVIFFVKPVLKIINLMSQVNNLS